MLWLNFKFDRMNSARHWQNKISNSNVNVLPTRFVPSIRTEPSYLGDVCNLKEDLNMIEWPMFILIAVLFMLALEKWTAIALRLMVLQEIIIY